MLYTILCPDLVREYSSFISYYAREANTLSSDEKHDMLPVAEKQYFGRNDKDVAYTYIDLMLLEQQVQGATPRAGDERRLLEGMPDHIKQKIQYDYAQALDALRNMHGWRARMTDKGSDKEFMSLYFEGRNTERPGWRQAICILYGLGFGLIAIPSADHFWWC